MDDLASLLYVAPLLRAAGGGYSKIRAEQLSSVTARGAQAIFGAVPGPVKGETQPWAVLCVELKSYQLRFLIIPCARDEMDEGATPCAAAAAVSAGLPQG